MILCRAAITDQQAPRTSSHRATASARQTESTSAQSTMSAPAYVAVITPTKIQHHRAGLRTNASSRRCAMAVCVDPIGGPPRLNAYPLMEGDAPVDPVDRERHQRVNHQKDGGDKDENLDGPAGLIDGC